MSSPLTESVPISVTAIAPASEAVSISAVGENARTERHASASPRELAPLAHIGPDDAPRWDDLATRFRPIFARIAVGAVEREQKRELPFEEVEWLKEAGFGRLRVPKAYGGFGATLPQLFRLLVELGEADSNVSHLFRGHFSFLEAQLNVSTPQVHERWFSRVVAGQLLGYAMAERTAHTGGSAVLLKEEGRYFVDGTKYYSTGTLYADWIIVSLLDGKERVSVAVPTDAPGVTRLDDWEGFGQRLTGSGTTKFDRVPIAEDQIIRRFDPLDFVRSYQKSFLQLVLLASVAGVGRAVLRDAIAFVRPRTRAFGIPGLSSPRSDPLVQRVVGKVSSLSFSAESLVLTIAQHLEDLYQLNQSGKATDDDFIATEIKAFQAQQIVLPQVLEAATLIFEVGGASATSEAKRLDRHWRNARTAASHNPAIHREAAIGDFLLNGTAPDKAWRDAYEKQASSEPAPEGSVSPNQSTQQPSTTPN